MDRCTQDHTHTYTHRHAHKGLDRVLALQTNGTSSANISNAFMLHRGTADHFQRERRRAASKLPPAESMGFFLVVFFCRMDSKLRAVMGAVLRECTRFDGRGAKQTNRKNDTPAAETHESPPWESSESHESR